MLSAFRWHVLVDTKHPLYREVTPSQRLKTDDQLVDTLLPCQAKFSRIGIIMFIKAMATQIITITFGIDASLTNQIIQTLALLSRIFGKVFLLTTISFASSKDSRHSDGIDVDVAVVVGDLVNDIKYDSNKDNIDWPEIDNVRKEVTQMLDAFALAFVDKIVSFIQDIANANESAEAEKEKRQGALMSRLQAFGLKSATVTTLTSRT
ncbi:hypothetical protein RFI_13316 [Reticulomyxa filosa]|uniref:Uncharacterized protein n=1 Tax=Reticulomyxa filosa TaxID=46433 RepID=X6NEU6_RETFI|nr:hypothetical protein RFI_13316 [Reticulomyxa filosa]|eukprot:ETO23852.1 hypothetical protein RFI_13316 [Reticulomyxa filosa]